MPLWPNTMCTYVEVVSHARHSYPIRERGSGEIYARELFWHPYLGTLNSILTQLALWHDHATLLGPGVVMITVHVVYDPAVFYAQN